MSWLAWIDWQGIGADLRQHWMVYLSLPVASAIIGYVTKVVAIQMMFHPIEFIGIRPWLGWQGIVPRKAEKMAGMAVTTLTSRLISVSEVFNRLDPLRVAAEIEKPLMVAMDRIVQDVAERYGPGLWLTLPEFIKQRINQRVKADVPQIVDRIMKEIRDNIDDVFDLKAMVVNNLVRDKHLLNSIFWRTGRQEFKFFGTAGFYFGLALGVVQMVTWVFFKEPWILPAFGLIVGLTSDWLALQLLFRPLRPRRVFGLQVQGLFLARQKEVAEEYGALIADQLLTPQKLLEGILSGPLSDRLMEVIQRHVKQAVDEQAGMAKPIVAMAVGSRKYVEIKQLIADAILKELPQTVRHATGYAEDAMDIRNTLITKLKALSSEEFEDMLRPVFKEDEWILIAVGAALGFLVGELQVFVMLH
ncbi:Uncharacterized membrane protein YheB, UPF0754 family [Hydrocarboniphaga daqingensis]|jgi:uncharacterized membrane protein YheB (UPF0754 family)|uniref:Uncharacterized membrane protein YheB, UPF0754 family n=1 Tax=Hydrocarboniphaga daqingensis TaxID=490188 RepID=A0A1M5QKW8_9GAMM|nr:DUF445 family protein [Hydrocarboniphaga daqingensis]SHH14782.1 Uncharacterized membrane protein YheB, UPF0754 family [Hydrocarboniphaga daqingensis]